MANEINIDLVPNIDNVFKDKEEMENHVARSHGNDQGDKKCPECKMLFTTEIELKIHMNKREEYKQLNHGSLTKKWTYPRCYKEYKNSKHLRDNKTTYHGKKAK